MDGQRRFNYVTECFGEHEAGKLDGALMKRKDYDEKLVHKSKSQERGCVRIYRTTVSMQFVYQCISRIDGFKKGRNNEFEMRDLSFAQQVLVAQV